MPNNKPTAILNIEKVKKLWQLKLNHGDINYDPEEGSLTKLIEPFVVKFLSGRADYLRKTPPEIFTSINMPHNKQDVFCASQKSITSKQKLSNITIKNFHWNLMTNNSPTSPTHCLLIPQDKPKNQIMNFAYLQDLIELASQNPKFSIAFNSLKAGATQNHFHVHLFNEKWPISKLSRSSLEKINDVILSQVNNYPIQHHVFQSSNTTKLSLLAIHAIDQLVKSETPHNILINNDSFFLIPRKKDNIDGIKYGADAVCGKFIVASQDLLESMDKNQLIQLLQTIAFSPADSVNF